MMNAAANRGSIGVAMLSLPMLSQGEVDCDSHIKNMSCHEMEKLLQKQTRRPAGHVAPQSAGALLEENKQLSLEKQHRKALDRKNSRDFIERLHADDRVATEADKAKDIGRRTAQRGLSQYYKAKIAEKETSTSKTAELQAKLDKGVDIQFFPFVEGETISENRKASANKMRDEMRTFLRKQHEENPPRADAMMLDADVEYHHRYPLMPVGSASARGPRQPLDSLSDLCTGQQRYGSTSARACGSTSARSSREGSNGDAVQTGPHLAKYPKFLSRAREHMSRRVHDSHVRKALEDKVERTKAELEDLNQKRYAQAQEWEDGMMVNDALRYDGSQLKAAARQRHASHLLQQAEDSRQLKKQEVEAKRAEPAGYWGPDNKDLQDPNAFRQLASGLIHQMETKQNRKLDSRSRRLQQEQVVIDNSLAEMSADRVKEHEKLTQHRVILTTTWESQQKLQQVRKRIDKL